METQEINCRLRHKDGSGFIDRALTLELVDQCVPGIIIVEGKHYWLKHAYQNGSYEYVEERAQTIS